MRSIVAYLLTLMIALSYGQFEKSICVGDIEIAFSVAEKNYYEARASCQRYGGDLVKIASSAIQTAIENAIEVRPEYYIGAHDSDADNTFHWVADNTEVPKNRLFSAFSSGYHNWKSNQPNNRAEKCVVIGVHSVYTWSDVYCTMRYRYICQRASEQMLSVSKRNHIVTCSSSASDVTVRWEKSVDSSTCRNRVYQRIGTNSATLHLENANANEAVPYTCVSSVSSCNARKTYTVLIDQFEKNICVGDVEIAFSIERKNYYEARASCQNYGGDLIKIESSALQTAIENTIEVRPEYYIGAHDSDADNTFHWVIDNTEVPKNPLLSWTGPSSGYQNWRPNQPNTRAEKCVVIGLHSVYPWTDVPCTTRYRYICQRASEHMLTFSKSNNIVTCTSSASSVAVRWEKSVDSLTCQTKVYQRIGSNNATLHLENVNVTETGPYTCVSSVSSCTARKIYIDSDP